MKQHFTDPQIVELALFVGAVEGMHKFNAAFDIAPPTYDLYQTFPRVPEEMREHLELFGIKSEAKRE